MSIFVIKIKEKVLEYYYFLYIKRHHQAITTKKEDIEKLKKGKNQKIT